MSDKRLIFTQTMRLVAAEIADKCYHPEQVEKLFEKYLPVVTKLAEKHFETDNPLYKREN